MRENEPNNFALDTTYAVENKWIGYLPLENVLGKKFPNLELHLTRFSLPQIEAGSMTTSFKGYEKEMPTKVMNAGSKNLILDYIVDANWENYCALYAWMSGLTQTENLTFGEQNQPYDKIVPSDFVPLRIYLIGPFKNKIVQFVFEDCWIKSFGELELDVSYTDEVKHNMTLVYDNFKVESGESLKNETKTPEIKIP